MGCCSSQPSGQAPSGRGAFPAPLPPPMQDNVSHSSDHRVILSFCTPLFGGSQMPYVEHGGVSTSHPTCFVEAMICFVEA